MNIEFSPLENTILNLLVKGPFSAVELVENITLQRPATVRQSVYKALRRLKDRDIIATVERRLVINQQWITDIAQWLLQRPVSDEPILSLLDGETISYTLPSFVATDQLWNHMLYVLHDFLPNTTPYIFWTYYHWFALVRTESEKRLYQYLSKKNPHILYTLAADCPANRLTKEKFISWGTRVNIEKKPSFPSRYYVTVLGDFCIEVVAEKKRQAQIDAIYKRVVHFDKKTTEELRAIVEAKGRIRMKISRDSKKAAKLRKKFSKDFYIPTTYTSHQNLPDDKA